jgi:outer membrane immunogenic protein
LTLADLGSIPNGPGLGGAIGYNIQPSQNGLVLGARIETSWVNFKSSGNIQAADLSFEHATNYLGAANLLVGLPLSPDGRFMGYLTGGFAWGGSNPNLTIGSGATAAINTTSTGYDLGGGFAYQFTPNWTGFIELDWYKLGDKSTPILGDMTATAKISDIVQKVGVLYKFSTF